MTDRSTLAFADTETTSLGPLRRIWNIGLIRRSPTGVEISEEIIINKVDLSTADRKSLEVGHFWHRHPDHGGIPGEGCKVVADEAEAARWLMARLRPQLVGDAAVPVHIVGAVPSFDVESFTALLVRNQQCWPGHYHLIDSEVLAVGALAARGVRMDPPYTSDELCALLGIDGTRYAKHTALGDTQWTKDLYDAAMRSADRDPPDVRAALAAARRDRMFGPPSPPPAGNR
jgi:hypothetical protein